MTPEILTGNLSQRFISTQETNIFSLTELRESELGYIIKHIGYYIVWSSLFTIDDATKRRLNRFFKIQPKEVREVVLRNEPDREIGSIFCDTIIYFINTRPLYTLSEAIGELAFIIALSGLNSEHINYYNRKWPNYRGFELFGSDVIEYTQERLQKIISTEIEYGKSAQKVPISYPFLYSKE